MAYTNYNEIRAEADAKMAKAIDSLKHNLSGLRTGRASTALLDGLMVMAYGAPTPINQVASLSTPDARTISVSVWDRGNIAAVEKAIRDANLGLNPASDGTLIRCPLPVLTEERRKELTKIASGYCEDAKQAIRHIRQAANDGVAQLKKDKLATEDDERSHKEDIQKLTDKYTGLADENLKSKQADIMSI
ncbi:MAG: ribosome recycling factor [Alphaproteobacteria bacterium]|nr:ribosome recycling factor [Alphaproteobacteria bacterium]